LIGAALAGALASSARAEPVCAAAGRDSAAIAAITQRFEAQLDDGRLIRLAGLAPTPGDFAVGPQAGALKARIEAEWVGRPVVVQALGGADRWGRIPAIAQPVEGGPDLAAALLRLGAVQVGDAREGGIGGPECPAARLAAEAVAREAGVGLWSGAYYGVLRAQDRAGLIARAGSFALVEGTVRRVGTGRLRLYLDFGTGADDFSVTATTRSIRAFEAAGVTLRALAGRRLRVRGVLEIFAGRAGGASRLSPRMEIAGPGALEIIDGEAP
jgi:hypothetical protein